MRDAVRRLAAAYRAAATWQQALVLAGPLAVCALAQAPWAWAGAAALLGVLFYLRLDLGLRLVVLAIPFAFAYKHVGTDIYSLPEILTLACFAAWVAGRISAGFPRPIPGRGNLALTAMHALDWGVLAFVAAAALSWLSAADKAAAQWELRVLIVEPALVYVMVRSLATANENSPRARAPGGESRHVPGILESTWHVSTAIFRAAPGRPATARCPTRERVFRPDILALADALTAAALIIALIGLYQYLFTDYVEFVQGVRRILSLYDSPNHVSLFLGRVVPISLCLTAFGAVRWRRAYHTLALLPLLLCLYLTYSRGAWLLGLPAALIFIGAMQGRRGRLIATGSLVAALLALIPILHTPRIASLLTLQSGTNFLRLVLWQGTARMIAAHPVFGVGLGNFVSQYSRYMLPEGGHEPVVYHPHNLLLDTWTAMGLPGIVALAFVLIAFFRTGLRAYRAGQTAPEERAFLLGLLASMAGFLAHGVVDTGFRLTDLAFVFMLTLGMMRCADGQPGSPHDGR